MKRRSLLACLAALLALALARCGEDDESGSAAATPEATPTAEARGADNQDTSAKPTVAKPSGEPPARLVKEDIVTGKGRAAKAGDQVTVQYVGVSYSTGEQFDASWDSGSPFPFELGAGAVIPGWDEGVPGMKVGGRRKLTIPPELGYGEEGTPDGAIAPNETLVFVVDVVDIQ
jgi:peptidylprolyl isomerase